MNSACARIASNPANATIVLKAFFDSIGLKYHDTRDIRRPCGMTIPYFHLYAVRDNARPMLMRVRSATIQRRESWASTTHTYMDRAKMQEAADWATSTGGLFDTVLVYVMKAKRPSGPGQFDHFGSRYNLVGIQLSDFLRHMRHRAQGGPWEDKCDLSAEVFKEHARALSAWLNV